MAIKIYSLINEETNFFHHEQKAGHSAFRDGFVINQTIDKIHTFFENHKGDWKYVEDPDFKNDNHFTQNNNNEYQE